METRVITLVNRNTYSKSNEPIGRENAREYITVASGLASDLLKKWREILQLVVQHL